MNFSELRNAACDAAMHTGTKVLGLNLDLGLFTVHLASCTPDRLAAFQHMFGLLRPIGTVAAVIVDGVYHRSRPPVTHRRDAAGSLLCARCNGPYPYASPPSSGEFICRSCKSYEEM